MNRRIAKNGILVAVLCAAAALLPAQKSVADPTCGPACQSCVQQISQLGYTCLSQCAANGIGAACPQICADWVQASIAQYCYPLG